MVTDKVPNLKDISPENEGIVDPKKGQKSKGK